MSAKTLTQFDEECGTTSENIVDSVLPPRKPKEKKDITYYLRIGAWIFALGILGAVFFYAVMGVQYMHNQNEMIKCYECIAFYGSKRVEEPGLPYERDCMTAPTNVRMCNPGQICAAVKVESKSTTRFHRSCSDEKILGCNTIEKPAKTSACFCNKPLCMK